MANSPRTYTQRFLLEHPICCYCGGNNPATTRDHVPAKILFDGKHRPKGIEVPACDQCQQYAKKHELVAAMIARLYPDASTRPQKLESKKLFQRANRAVPGLLEEMQPSPRQEARMLDIGQREKNAGGVLNMGGYLLIHSLDIFAIKMVCGLHYEKTKKIVPIGRPISTRIFSNVDALDGKIPQETLEILGKETTLQQGKWSVGDQFSYAYAIADTQDIAIYFSTFRKSFAVLGLIWKSAEDLPQGEGMKTFTPQANGKFLRIR